MVEDLTLKQWLRALDAMTFYELFRARSGAPHDELRAAFHVFAESFHPDLHRGRPPREQEAIGRIYRRGMEAWRVLSDPALRARYDRALATGSRPRGEQDPLDPPAGAARAGGSPAARASDAVRSPAARPFVIRAEELVRKGDPKQAKIQLVMAMHIEKGNPHLEAFAKQLDALCAKPP